MSLVTIHLLTYNGARFVEDCLESVLGQTYPNLEILVTDNASTDGTIDKIKYQISNIKNDNGVVILRNASDEGSDGNTSGGPRTRSFADAQDDARRIRVFLQDENIGFAAGHNLGIHRSTGEYILCLNQDVVLDKDFVEYAVETMENDLHIGAVQGKLLRVTNGNEIASPATNSAEFGRTRNDGGRIIDTVGLQPLKSRRFVNRGQGETDRGQYEKVEEIFGADGAAPLYRRTAIEDVKLPIPNTGYEYFDEDFFMYKEDIDLAWRLRLAGWKTVYQPGAVAWHARTAGSAISIAKARQVLPSYAKYHSFKNQRLLLLKNDNPWYFVRHLPWALPYEIVSWLWVIFFEPKTWGAMLKVFRLLADMLRKRKIIMAKRCVPWGDVYGWFR